MTNNTEQQAVPVAQEDREAVATIVRRAMQDEFLSGSEWSGSIGRVAGRCARANVYAHEILALVATSAATPDATQTREAELASRCDGKEQYAFEEWAKSQRYDMSEHPLHYLFLDAKTSAARDGWAAGLKYASDVARALSPQTLPAPGEVDYAEMLQTAWESCPSGDGLGLPPIIFSDAEAAHIVKSLATVAAANDEGVFAIGDRVEKIKGSSWCGIIVGTYSTKLTPEGYAVESEREPGSVQIYPAAAIRLLSQGGGK